MKIVTFPLIEFLFVDRNDLSECGSFRFNLNLNF